MADVLQQADAPAWYKFVTDFDKSYADFETNYAVLQNLKSYIYTKHPELRAQYDDLIARAAKEDTTLQTLRGVRDTANGWLSTLGGVYQGAVSTVSDWFYQLFGPTPPTGLQGLGFIPVVMGVAAATASLAAITYWLTDAYKFAQKINAMQALEAKGMSAADAAKAVANLEPAGGTLFGIPIVWLIVGGAALYLLPFFLKRKG